MTLGLARALDPTYSPLTIRDWLFAIRVFRSLLCSMVMPPVVPAQPPRARNRGPRGVADDGARDRPNGSEHHGARHGAQRRIADTLLRNRSDRRKRRRHRERDNDPFHAGPLSEIGSLQQRHELRRYYDAGRQGRISLNAWCCYDVTVPKALGGELTSGLVGWVERQRDPTPLD